MVRVATELLDRAAAHARGSATDEVGGPANLESLVRQYWANVPDEDLCDRSPVDAVGAARSQLTFGWRRPPGTALVRVVSPSEDVDTWTCPHSVVEVITDDMPFLVDSVTAELNRQGFSIHLVVHPQLRVRRDAVGEFIAVVPHDAPESEDLVAESWIHVEIDRHSDVSVFAGLQRDLRRVLEDVRAAVEDWSRMRSRVGDAIAELRAGVPDAVPNHDVDETIALLEWIAADNFTFLGYRDYTLSRDSAEPVLSSVPATGLGILRDSGLQPVSLSFAKLAPEAREKAFTPELLTLTKANSRATVHRPAYIDYVGVKRLGADGVPTGERRFLGLFGMNAYSVSVKTIPVVRRKVAAVIERAGFPPRSHDATDLLQILETYPRDELFQISVDDLYEISMGILGLQERRRVRLFMRRDDYGRFVSCLVYLPRERYTTEVRLRMQSILMRALGGTAIDYSTRYSESVLVRVHFVVRTPSTPSAVDTDELQREMAAATRSWEDELVDAVVAAYGEEEGAVILRRYGSAFPEAYKEDFSPRVAVADIRRLSRLGGPEDLDLSLYKPARAAEGVRRFKIARIGPPLSLAVLMPSLQDMGVEVTDERPYGLTLGTGEPAWIYDFGLRHRAEDDFEADGVREAFQEAFAAVRAGRMSSDAFNALVLAGGLTWREVIVLRAYAAYLRQIGTTFSQVYIATALVNNVNIVRLLVDLFETRFSPGFGADRDADETSLVGQITTALDDVVSLDEDRILRSYLGLIRATMRTNHFLQKDYLCLKLEPGKVPEMPAPRPAHEIFVYSPRVEGVHLRFGAVARGGLRWSDRREDFRTEVLGLVKAQMVKNAVIVPVGAKGGFVIKQAGLEAVDCYSEFVRGLLDLADNIVDGSVVPPAGIVRHDGDDPYLVVAADKGTATFSDLANDIAADYGFWLGDAFASGGSEGYDHKAMGITARGAWESVKRHFRELGVNVQEQEFTCVGIGDMSGDVFGNGVLLSRHLRLVAAFDHRHIFIDPNPDTAASYDERTRLFHLPRSSWDDYDRALISAGGGVWPRSAKSIPLSAEARAALDVSAEALTPLEVIRAILQAPVDLLWNGGIGTYVKASSQRNAEVGDRANDAVRVNGRDLRCRVVGEGGNLGCTQQGRVEYAQHGGLIYTDAIDNSAGVDTSDHEVNIKILLGDAIRNGEMSRGQRNELLASMTDEVAALVLRDNYEQTIALGNAVAQAPQMLHVHARLIDWLVANGHLDRELESLPGSDEIASRQAAGTGLTAPEFAVLLAYRKITLTADVLASDLPDEPYFAAAMETYFPNPLRDGYRKYMDGHRLRREIVATAVVNHMVNRTGTTFLLRLGEETGSSVVEVTRAHAVAWHVFDMDRAWAAVEALDNVIAADVQTTMFLEARQLVERASRWFLNNRRPPIDVEPTIAAFAPGVEAVTGKLTDMLTGSDRVTFDERCSTLANAGVPGDVAEQFAVLTPLYSALDIVDVSASSRRPVEEVAELYFTIEDRLALGRLRDLVNALPRDDRWHTLARAALRDDLYGAHAALTAEVLASTDSASPTVDRLTQWIEKNAGSVQRAAQLLADIDSGDHAQADLATLSVALRQIRSVIRSAANS
ncbi:MAG: NAD-glutamate dehydrogenase [Actinomycetes bacterium]